MSISDNRKEFNHNFKKMLSSKNGQTELNLKDFEYVDKKPKELSDINQKLINAIENKKA